MEQNRCTNCSGVTGNNFCSNCGQSVKTGRLNFHYLFHEFQHTVLHADKGIIYTAKELFVNPDKIIRNYIEGKRVNIFKPFGFLIVLATIYGFLSHYLNITYELDFSFVTGMTDNEMADIKSNYYNIYKVIYSHYSVFSLVSIFPLAFFSRFIFRKSGYNYIEHLVANAYILGQQCLIYTLLIPLFYISSGNIYFDVATLLTFVYLVWVYVKLFAPYSSTAINILKALFVFGLYTLAIAIAGLIIGIFLY